MQILAVGTCSFKCMSKISHFQSNSTSNAVEMQQRYTLKINILFTM